MECSSFSADGAAPPDGTVAEDERRGTRQCGVDTCCHRCCQACARWQWQRQRRRHTCSYTRTLRRLCRWAFRCCSCCWCCCLLVVVVVCALAAAVVVVGSDDCVLCLAQMSAGCCRTIPLKESRPRRAAAARDSAALLSASLTRSGSWPKNECTTAAAALHCVCCL